VFARAVEAEQVDREWVVCSNARHGVVADKTAAAMGGAPGRSRSGSLRWNGPAFAQGSLASMMMTPSSLSYPPATYARLTEVKGRYDSTNMFRLNQNIPPSVARDRQP
jgi:Berberine and berberine like